MPSKRLPSKMIRREQAVFLETSKCPNSETLCLVLCYFFSKKSSDVFIWGLDAINAFLGVGEKGVMG